MPKGELHLIGFFHESIENEYTCGKEIAVQCEFDIEQDNVARLRLPSIPKYCPNCKGFFDPDLYKWIVEEFQRMVENMDVSEILKNYAYSKDEYKFDSSGRDD